MGSLTSEGDSILEAADILGGTGQIPLGPDVVNASSLETGDVAQVYDPGDYYVSYADAVAYVRALKEDRVTFPFCGAGRDMDADAWTDLELSAGDNAWGRRRRSRRLQQGDDPNTWPQTGIPLSSGSWRKNTSPWSTARPCVWPIDAEDQRLCGDTVGARHCSAAPRTVEVPTGPEIPFYNTTRPLQALDQPAAPAFGARTGQGTGASAFGPLPVGGNVTFVDDGSRYCGSNMDAFGNDRFMSERFVESATGIAELNFGFTTFDNVMIAFVTILQSITLEGWVLVMYQLQDSFNPLAGGFFMVGLVIFAGYFLLNLVLAVLWQQYSESQRADLEAVNRRAAALDLIEQKEKQERAAEEAILLRLQQENRRMRRIRQQRRRRLREERMREEEERAAGAAGQLWRDGPSDSDGDNEEKKGSGGGGAAAASGSRAGVSGGSAVSFAGGPILSAQSAHPGRTGPTLAGASIEDKAAAVEGGSVIGRVRSFFGGVPQDDEEKGAGGGRAGAREEAKKRMKKGHSMRVPPPAQLRKRQPVFMKLLKRTKTALIRAQMRGELSAPMQDLARNPDSTQPQLPLRGPVTMASGSLLDSKTGHSMGEAAGASGAHSPKLGAVAPPTHSGDMPSSVSPILHSRGIHDAGSHGSGAGGDSKSHALEEGSAGSGKGHMKKKSNMAWQAIAAAALSSPAGDPNAMDPISGDPLEPAVGSGEHVTPEQHSAAAEAVIEKVFTRALARSRSRRDREGRSKSRSRKQGDDDAQESSRGLQRGGSSKRSVGTSGTGSSRRMGTSSRSVGTGSERRIVGNAAGSSRSQYLRDHARRVGQKQKEARKARGTSRRRNGDGPDAGGQQGQGQVSWQDSGRDESKQAAMTKQYSGRSGVDQSTAGPQQQTSTIARLARIGLEDDADTKMKHAIRHRSSVSPRTANSGGLPSTPQPGVPMKLHGLIGARPSITAGRPPPRPIDTGTAPESNLADALLAAGSAEGLMTPGMALQAMRRAGFQEEDLDHPDHPIH